MIKLFIINNDKLILSYLLKFARSIRALIKLQCALQKYKHTVESTIQWVA